MKKPKVVSLFSGAGGLDIGFEKAGFEIAVAVEADSSCCNTLRKNHPKLNIIEGKLEEISSAEIMKAGGLDPLETALVIGGPPCQPFSLAGKREGLSDPRGRLLLEYIRIVRDLLPKGFVLENVKGLMNWDKGHAKELLVRELEEPVLYKDLSYEYKVNFDVLNAVAFGVPQQRERVFFVGNRLGRKFKFPEPTHAPPDQAPILQKLPYVTVWDAIGSLPTPEQPSEVARRVATTIRGRIERHGY